MSTKMCIRDRSNPDLTLILISHHLSEQRKAQFDRVYQLTPCLLYTSKQSDLF